MRKEKVKVLIKEIPKGNPDIWARAINSMFNWCSMLGRTPHIYMKGYIYIYDIKDPGFVGALYPDGACMVCPNFWFYPRNDFEKGTYKLPLFSHVLEGRKKVVLKKHV